ncbi:SMP-30/gluconolactonase/LRE family protein [Hoeflea sp. CAU 1731]
MNQTVATYKDFSETACEVGEGPTYDTATGTTYWFDIPGKTLLEMSEKGVETIHTLPFAASVLAVIDDESQLIATENGLFRRVVADGSLNLIKELEPDKPENRSNDGRVHPSGALWIGTMGWQSADNAGAIYHYCKGELKTLFGGITVPNAICFTPDGASGYFTDTPTKKVMRVALDPATGLPVAAPTVFLDETASDRGFADGAVVDTDGNFWCARWDGACVQGFDPSGVCFETIELPTDRVTCPAFTGRDHSRMIVTSAYIGLDDDQMRAQPDAGETFLLEARFRGKADPRVLI